MVMKKLTIMYGATGKMPEGRLPGIVLSEKEWVETYYHLKDLGFYIDVQDWYELKNICSECEQERKDDERVKVGMKCMNCAYGV
jgi:hypothetical protein